MLALVMEESAVKDFMGKLLREGIFNSFDVRNIEIATTIHISIDGVALDKEKELSSWDDLRPLVYTIIKASTKPRFIKIAFFFQEPQSIHKNAKAVSLIMNYENDNITFTTATSQVEFVLDKSLDMAWDDWVRGFFLQKGITVSDR